MPKALKYDTDGMAHWVLERLTERPHSRDELIDLGLAHYGTGGWRVCYAAGALHSDLFIKERAGKYEITRSGEAGLKILQEGRALFPRGEPSVRVFVPAGAMPSTPQPAAQGDLR